MAKKKETQPELTPEELAELSKQQLLLRKMLEEYERNLEMQEAAKVAKQTIDETVETQKNRIAAAIMDLEDRFGIQATALTEKHKYTVGRKSYYRVTDEHKESVLRSLRALGWGELIQQRVDPRTLSKAIQEITPEDGTLSRRYRNLVANLESYDQTTLYKRKR